MPKGVTCRWTFSEAIKYMDLHTFLLQLMVVLLTARIFSEVATFLQAPSVMGELLAGLLLGPSFLGWVQPTQMIKILAEIGIILLLFEVGLETDVTRLMKAGPQALLVAVAGFVMPFIFGFIITYLGFGLSLLVALFVGGTLTATSIGITVRVLSDLRRHHSKEGEVVIGAAVVDDVLGVILLALLYEYSVQGEVSLVNSGKVLLFVAAFFLVAPVVAKLVSLVIKHFEEISETPGMIPTTVVSLVLLFAWLAHEVGAPELLGGFAAGLALSRRFFLPFGVAIKKDFQFARRVDQQMKPIIHLFTPIFFVTVGLSLNLRTVAWQTPFIWEFSLLLLVAAIIGKFTGALLVKEPWVARVAIGVAMVPRGEVGLIFAELGRVSGIFTNDLYAGLVIVIAFTTVITPFVMKWFYGRYGRRLKRELATQYLKERSEKRVFP
jgi:Kef-type K+ transport system membrane component KefB